MCDGKSQLWRSLPTRSRSPRSASCATASTTPRGRTGRAYAAASNCSPIWRPTLDGLEGFSHVIVVGWLDRIPAELRERRQAHPGGDERLPLLGALALRGGARPNPIAVTVCRLRSVRGASVEVEGLDLIDGTPVLDIKPYIAVYDSEPGATLPDWAQG